MIFRKLVFFKGHCLKLSYVSTIIVSRRVAIEEQLNIFLVKPCLFLFNNVIITGSYIDVIPRTKASYMKTAT